jgi:hypothetical protein
MAIKAIAGGIKELDVLLVGAKIRQWHIAEMLFTANLVYPLHSSTGGSQWLLIPIHQTSAIK